MKLRKGDKVRIISGKDKGKEGTIERVYENSNKVLLPGLNMYKKHVRKSDQFPQGGVMDVPRPLDASKVMFVSGTTKKVTRLGYVVENGKKISCREIYQRES
ncbi:MAG: 50S ribosomal protein L24 [Microgenomates bacterium OLB23]|nr:MAG: 50S ribosomal protein L24 [Microgenomates bacterium OLB23]